MTKSKRKIFIALYSLAFLWGLAISLPAYIQSSFLAQFVGVDGVGLFLAAATTVTFAAILWYPSWIKRYSNFNTAALVLALAAFSLVYLVSMTNPWIILVLFIIQYVALVLFGISLDIFLESVSDNKHTGQIRAGFFTIANLGWLVAPFIMSRLVGESSYGLPFFASALIVFPIILILLASRRLIKIDQKYTPISLRRVWKKIIATPNLKTIFTLSVVIRVFYLIAVLYVPIYLNQQIGFNWQQIGIMFTIMLLPFILFQLPAGIIADRRLGEKEILILGLTILISATLMIFLFRGPNLIIWTVILFGSRVGAALYETMLESYFFKQINVSDLGIINVFRAMSPAGALIGAALSVVVLFLLPLQYIFLVLAGVLALACWPALKLHDTR